MPLIPRPTCPVCVEGVALQAVGGWLPGVPFCLEHELPDGEPAGDGGDEVTRRPLPTVLLDRWRLRVSARLFGWALPIAWLLLVCRRAVGWLLWHPRTTGGLCAAGGLLWAVLVHPVELLAGALLVAEPVHAWALVARPAARARVRARAASAWRAVWRYRRRWRTAVRIAGLTRDGEVPRLGRVTATPTTDLLRVRGLLGQRFGEWEDAAPMIAHVLGATGYSLHRGDDRRLTLELVRGPRGRSWNRQGYVMGADL